MLQCEERIRHKQGGEDFTLSNEVNYAHSFY